MEVSNLALYPKIYGVIFLLSLLWPYWPGLALEGGGGVGWCVFKYQTPTHVEKVILAWIITKNINASWC